MTKISYKLATAGASAIWVLAAACGGGEAEVGAEDADRQVEVRMVDNAFEPNALTVSAGETVAFRFKNDGAVTHDAFIGDAEEQEKHGKAMDSGDHEGHNMEGGDSLLLDSGESGDLTYTFEEAGEILIGCHQPGHYEAGMKSTITVT